MKPRLTSPGTLRIVRHLLWGVAAICFATVAFAHLDAALFAAEADRQLDSAISSRSSAAALDARALEKAVERDLEELAAGSTESSPRDESPALREPAASAAAGRPEPTARPATAAPVVGTTEILGRLKIPRLGLSVPIAEGVELNTLRRAAGRIPGTAALGGAGNVGIAGHRDGVFRELSRAAAGDLVIVETPDGHRHYRIEAVSIVQPKAVDVLAATDHPTLTLVTCYPFDLLGPAPERWVVRARRVERSPSS